MGQPAERRVLLYLVGLALLTRLLWVLVIHPPGDYVSSDMRLYVDRAKQVAVHGLGAPDRTMAWQAYGTHVLLAAPMRLFGTQPPYTAAAVLWGLLGAAAVPLAYLLACRLLQERWQARAAGIGALVWYPNLSTTGFFLSETPFLTAQLLAVYWLVVCIQDGRRAWAAGFASAAAFVLRPQAAVFFALLAIVWLVNVRRLPHVRVGQIVGVAVPLALALAFSMWRFHYHAGYWGGVAENANMNLTAGRCHNILTQAYATKAERDRAERAGDLKSGRRVSLPGYRALYDNFDDDDLLGLRPALGISIRFVGYIGDPFIHRDLRAQCYAKTGVGGQLQYTVTNLLLQWFFARQWPDTQKGYKVFLPISETFRYFFLVVVLAPSLWGTGMALRRIRREPALAACAMCLLGSMIVAAVFFGDPRLRTPYDPYAMILALYAVGAWLARRRARPSATAG